jgi:glycosyltransferase involved in cell wall biosynthesis
MDVTYDLSDRSIDAVLVVGGTRRLSSLRRLRASGVPVFQRLNGMNWIHRRVRTGLRHYLRAEVANLLLRAVRDRFADGVIYQSAFARGWWERVFGPAPAKASVVHNGVPLEVWTPRGPESPSDARTRLLVVEGNLAGGYEHGLEAAFALGAKLQSRLETPLEVAVAGRASESLRREWERRAVVQAVWLGLIPPSEIPGIDRGAHLLFAADLHPACPNAVVEALACGLPVVSFDTGALPELVTGDAGRLASYGGDAWRLDPPDIEALTSCALEILGDQPRFRRGARARAEAGLGLDPMVEGYLRAFGWAA